MFETCCWDFDSDWTESSIVLVNDVHFNNVNSSNP